MPGVSCSKTPILGCDVWEHAYYLKYQTAVHHLRLAEVVDWKRLEGFGNAD